MLDTDFVYDINFFKHNLFSLTKKNETYSLCIHWIYIYIYY